MLVPSLHGLLLIQHHELLVLLQALETLALFFGVARGGSAFNLMLLTLLLNFMYEDVSIDSLWLLGGVVVVHIYHVVIA